MENLKVTIFHLLGWDMNMFFLSVGNGVRWTGHCQASPSAPSPLLGPMLVAIYSPSLLQQRENKENQQVLCKELWLTCFPNVLTFLFWCVRFARCCQGLQLLHHSSQSGGQETLAGFLMPRAGEESVLSAPNISQGLHAAESWLTAGWLSVCSRWISPLLVLMGFA